MPGFLKSTLPRQQRSASLQPHRATRTRFARPQPHQARTSSAALLAAKRVHMISASRVSVRALERCTQGLASLRIVLTTVVHRSACHTLRFYITPHLHKCPASRSQARLVARHRCAPFGFCKQALCKVPCTGGGHRFACFPVGAPTPPYARAPVPARGLPAL